jgi:hypothetical protein
MAGVGVEKSDEYGISMLEMLVYEGGAWFEVHWPHCAGDFAHALSQFGCNAASTTRWLTWRRC